MLRPVIQLVVRLGASLAFLAFALITTSVVPADVFEIGPSTAGPDCVEEFEEVANRLKPGDTLILRGGRYSQSCRRALSIRGTRERPIVIRAATGERPVLTRPEHNRLTQNNLELVDTQFVSVDGIEFEGGSIGVRLMGEVADFEFANSTIRDTGTTAFAANNGNSNRLYLHHNVIHTTGQSAGKTEGEGFYLGCHSARCRVTNSRIEHNTLYNLHGKGAGGNDGIELKPGSGGNRVAHNQITGQNKRSDFPCILAYGNTEAVNVIENNTLKNCGEGIQVVQNAVVRGNLIIDSARSGIVIRRHRTVGAPSNVAVVNNTVVNRHFGSAALHLSLWRSRDIVVHNNALFSTGRIAVKGSHLRAAGFATNWASGSLRGVPLGQTGILRAKDFRALEEGDPALHLMLDVFTDAGTDSPLTAGSRDNRGVSRPQGSAVDIGAFERVASK